MLLNHRWVWEARGGGAWAPPQLCQHLVGAGLGRDEACLDTVSVFKGWLQRRSRPPFYKVSHRKDEWQWEEVTPGEILFEQEGSFS